MKYKTCPVCGKEIPDYRADDPYCDCGWQLFESKPVPDELNWIVVFLAILVVWGVQIVLLAFNHLVGSVAFSLPANFLAEYIPEEYVSLMYWFLINLLDFVSLSILYFMVGYFISCKSSSPLIVTITYGIIVLFFKVVVIDHRSNQFYPMMVYIMDFLLLLVAIASGWLSSYVQKLRSENRSM